MWLLYFRTGEKHSNNICHAGKLLTHKFLLREMWAGETDVQYLRIDVRSLRQKLEADPEPP
jgi:two-component system KDP operon response regulator KdpE